MLIGWINRDCVKAVEFILDAGVPVDQRGIEGVTPLALVESPEMLRLLFARGADPTQPDDEFLECMSSEIVDAPPED